MADSRTDQADRFIYLVQHGQAEPKTVDPDRPLTKAGRQTVEQAATWAFRVGLKVDQIRHSGKLRASQTAVIFAEKLRPSEGIASYPGLGPNDNVQPVADALMDCRYSVMLVGHLPFLSRLTGMMLADSPDRQLVRFRNGGLVGLVRDDEKWTIACVVPPELMTES
jgi:phosphohistidine phosphatase